jgi:16S rRNA (adenine1518-N6/adenine1519-N6)-dimethyltransferase
MADEIEDPRAVLRRHGLRPKRSWGQNFLVNRALVARMADEIARDGIEQVVEIGAGVGTLTAALAARVGRVVAVERDPDLVRLLRAESPSWGGRVEVVDADATSFDYVAAAVDGVTAIAGNLPYQITGRLLRRIVEARGVIRRAVVMVQSEVADRLGAAPGGKEYGVLGVMCQAWFEVTRLWRVAPGSFHPRPAVSSAVVGLVPLERPRVGDLSEDALARLVHAAFASRRKTLRNALSASFPLDDVLAALDAEGLEPSRRGETLSVEQLAALARRLCQSSQGTGTKRAPSRTTR